MKVAIVAPLVAAIREPQRGGSQAFVSDLARGLVDRGHEVHLYAASGSEVAGVQVIDTGVDHRALAASLYRASAPAADGSAVAEELAAEGPVAAEELAAAEGPAAAEAAFAAVYARVREGRYDVVHNHAFDAPAISLAAELNAPVVHTLHLPPDAAVAQALRHAAQRDPAPTIACVSARQASAWRRVVPVAAILPPYVPTGLIPWSPSPGEGAVFAGRFSPEKGVAEAIEIARAAGVRIDVYGDTYDADYTREQIEPRGAELDVSVHPGVPRTELWKLMAQAAVVLCPAGWEEPFGMVAAEAQACGTPVVAFRRGALDEVIRDGVTGWLVAPDDVSAAAAAVRNVTGLSRSACREHAESHLDLALSLDAHEQLYRQLLGAGMGAPAGG
jgi:glycosyltransferase involved in cell wall biosynthesis